MKTNECLDIVLREYSDYFTAKELAKIAGIPESTLCTFRKGETNSGVKIFDKIRMALYQISPIAYSRFIYLLSEPENHIKDTSEADSMIIRTMLENAPLNVQAKMLKTMASNGLFTRATEFEKAKKLLGASHFCKNIQPDKK